MVSFFNTRLAKTYKTIAVLLTIAIPMQTSADTIAIIGGPDLVGSAPAYAARITSSNEVITLTFSGGMALTGVINKVSISASGNSLIGGQDQSGPNSAYGALVSSSGVLTPLLFTGGLELHGFITSVAINSFGKGIIGGRDTFGPIYAALVPPSGNPLLPLTFSNPIALGGIINDVA
ncbi:MAG: hypothetical protein K2X08_07260, partial [Chlamydiales bacterium]|nr:hypothetical protein [Chlamydiales bacterium]